MKNSWGAAMKLGNHSIGRETARFHVLELSESGFRARGSRMGLLFARNAAAQSQTKPHLLTVSSARSTYGIFALVRGAGTGRLLSGNEGKQIVLGVPSVPRVLGEDSTSEAPMMDCLLLLVQGKPKQQLPIWAPYFERRLSGGTSNSDSVSSKKKKKKKKTCRAA